MARLASLGKNSVVYGLGQVLTRALSVLFLPLLTRYLSPADYGAIGLLTILNAILQPLLSLGTTMSLGPAYFRSENPEHRERVVGSALAFNLGGAAVLWAAGSLGGSAMAHALGRDELRTLIPYALGLAAFSQPLSIVQLWLQFTERSRASVALTFVQTVVTFGSALLLVVRFGLGARGMLAASTLGAATSSLGGIAILLSNSKPKFALHELRGLLIEGAPLLGGMAASFVINNGPRLVLERKAGLVELGYFTLGAQLALPMDLAVSAFTTAWYPFFMSFSTRQSEAPPIFGRLLRLYLWGFGLLTALAFAFARFGVLLVAAPRYEPAFNVVGLIAIARVFWGLYNIVVPGLYFTGKLGYVSVLQLAAAAIAIAGTFIVLPFSPLLACVLGIVVGNAALVIIQVLWNQREKLRIVEVGRARAPLLGTMLVAVSLVTLLPRHLGLLAELGLAVAVGSCAVLATAIGLPTTERAELIRFVRGKLQRRTQA